MSEPITMPALSDTMNSGHLVRWVKKPGDAIKKGDTIAEVETDKAIMEVEAFHDGYLAGPLAPEGTDMPVGKIIGYIADHPGESPAGIAQAAPPCAQNGAARDRTCGGRTGAGERGAEGRRGCGGTRRASFSHEASGSPIHLSTTGRGRTQCLVTRSEFFTSPRRGEVGGEGTG
jgi:pyruvate/2-oxoglutarate dehydrogenase complex dihydrolipoamide acyltransferase (E2) component